MRRLLVLATALSILACHRAEQTRPPVGPGAELDALIARIDGVADDPWPGACDELDAALAQLAETEVGREATYARAEAALRCDRPERWQALHEQLARADYLPSLGRLGDDAIERRDWDRALVIVERLIELEQLLVERERLRRLAAQIIHERWVDRGDPADFAWLERAAKVAIVREPTQLEARAALIRLYAEQAAIAGDQGALLLAQVSEQEARRVADELGLQSARLELVSGFVRELEGHRAAAVAAWTRALEINPALVEPHLWLGLAAIDRRDFAVAQEHLQAFLDVHTTHVEAHLALGAAARGAGDRITAERATVMASKLDSTDPRPYWNRVIAHDPWLLPVDAAEDQFMASLQAYRNALSEFQMVYGRLPPRECAPRGAAGSDPACVRETEALARALAEVDERVEAVDALRAEWYDHGCQYPARELEARLREQEEEHRQRLLELERQAKAAGEIELGEPTEE